MSVDYKTNLIATNRLVKILEIQKKTYQTKKIRSPITICHICSSCKCDT